MLVFLPGFLAPPGSYDALLAPLSNEGLDVVEPHFASALHLASGRYSPQQEAEDTIRLVQAMGSSGDSGRPCWLAGHSRGGQVAWRVAASGRLKVKGLVLVDPVDGAGPRPRSGQAVLTPPTGVPTLIVGAGRGGSCAPVSVNHETFAAALPAATHVTIADMGHADVLSGPGLDWGRRLCRGSEDPRHVRHEVSDLMLRWLGFGDDAENIPHDAPKASGI